MKYLAWLLLLVGCTRLVPVSDTTTTKTSTDTLSHAVTVNVPKSDVSVTINIDSLLGQAKTQDRIIYLKGESGRSSYDVAIKPNGQQTVECHCADSTLKVMQLLVTKLIEKEHNQVVKEEPTVFAKLARDVENNVFWVLVAGAVVVFFVLRK